MFKIHIQYQAYPVNVPYTELFETKEEALTRLKELIFYNPIIPFDASFGDLQMAVQMLTSGNALFKDFQNPEIQDMLADFVRILQTNTDEFLCKYYIFEIKDKDLVQH